MDEQFVLLCTAVATLVQTLKPIIKGFVKIEDTTAPLYNTGIWLLAILLGIAGAFAMRVNVAPSWNPTAGMIFTGIISALGSEVAHRILEVIQAGSQFAQNRAGQLPAIKG